MERQHEPDGLSNLEIDAFTASSRRRKKTRTIRAAEGIDLRTNVEHRFGRRE